MKTRTGLLPYSQSLAGTLLAAREAVVAPIRPSLRAVNVTEQQWRVLRVLDDGALDPTNLARRALLHPPSVTRILRELLERGLIHRASDASDARRSVVTITDAGRDLVTQAARETLKILTEIEARFGADRVAALRGELAALAQAIESIAAEEA
ncbi:MarR family transcriptional regulator [Phenylobacterium immobile]|uniref:MarR family transcriptional regulator n=1 Tax=Phenylobacterium immobile TaxID=21 RepID=UPI000AC44BDD|nr:MarR family transcriptional regulator [Phenylobacterium immobile]